MNDFRGQAVLNAMSKKPILEEDIAFIVDTLKTSCNFVDTWANLGHKTVVKVFGKKRAEREAVTLYQNSIRNSGVPTVVLNAFDEMCPSFSNHWTNATENASMYLV